MFGGASTAVHLAAEGVLAWPTIGMMIGEIPETLDAGVAQAMVLSRDGLHAAAGVLLGLSLFLVSWLLVRSDLWGHWLLAVVGFVAAVSSCSSMIVGPEGFGAGAILLWGIVVVVVLLVGLRRQGAKDQPDTRGNPFDRFCNCRLIADYDTRHESRKVLKPGPAGPILLSTPPCPGMANIDCRNRPFVSLVRLPSHVPARGGSRARSSSFGWASAE
jgi:hypothetical protein